MYLISHEEIYHPGNIDEEKTKTEPGHHTIEGKIQEAELTRTNILKDNGGSSASLCTSKLEDLKTLTQLIKDLRQEKDEIFQSQSKQANKKNQKVTNSKGKRTSTFWSVIKPQEEEAINSIKNKDGSQTTTQDETLSRAQEHYQDLFTPRERPPNKEPAKIPGIGKSRSLIKAFSLPTIRKALSKLKSNKVCGPD